LRDKSWCFFSHNGVREGVEIASRIIASTLRGRNPLQALSGDPGK
jgi:hypothetical protein